MQTSELIARLEAATGADRELDAAIAAAYGAVPDGYERASHHGKEKPYWWHSEYGKAPFWQPPAYTASIDAALTLVPANALWSVRALWDHGPDAIDGPKAYRGSVDVYEVRDGLFWKDNHLSLAPTPALALCLAALRAGHEGEGA